MYPTFDLFYFLHQLMVCRSRTTITINLLFASPLTKALSLRFRATETYAPLNLAVVFIERARCYHFGSDDLHIPVKVSNFNVLSMLKLQARRLLRLEVDAHLPLVVYMQRAFSPLQLRKLRFATLSLAQASAALY